MAKSKGGYSWFKEKILKRYFVRFHMSLILVATIASGLSIDKLLLAVGLTSMTWRYPVAVLLAYLVFLLLVRIWVWWVTGIQIKLAIDLFNSGDTVETGLDVGSDMLSGGSEAGEGFVGFSGGSSGGGGASDTFASSLLAETPPSVSPVSSGGGGGSSSGGSWFSSFDIDLDLGDAWWIVLLLAILVIVICGAGGYLIWIAPEILPEVALEVALAGGLMGATKRLEERGWVGGLVRSTCIPLLLVLLAAGTVGFFIQASCPSATRVMEALACPETPAAGGATAGK